MTIAGWCYRPARAGLLGLDAYPVPAERCRAVVVPFGLESALSYKGGAAAGAEALIAAGAEVEGFDEVAMRDTHRAHGIATLAPVAVAADHAAALEQIAELAGRLLGEGRLPLIAGGDHSLTIGAIRAFAARFSGLAVLQIDAHLDLRDSYMGSANSHACAMRRVLDHADVRLVSVGARSLDAGELAFAATMPERIALHLAKDRKRWRVADIVAPLAGRPIYVSFDVDGLDAALMPATGTPEPGGLSYDEACELIDAAGAIGRIVGGDVVELAPIAGLHACDFTAAKIAVRMLNAALRGL